MYLVNHFPEYKYGKRITGIPILHDLNTRIISFKLLTQGIILLMCLFDFSTRVRIMTIIWCSTYHLADTEHLLNALKIILETISVSFISKCRNLLHALGTRLTLSKLEFNQRVDCSAFFLLVNS